ncbi:MAG: alanine racemase [Candidatus Paceibacterota bacterium]|jgi:alanine racemase
MIKENIFYEREDGSIFNIEGDIDINNYFNKDIKSKIIEKNNLPITWMNIDLSQLEKNYKSILKKVGLDVGIISVLKANAYGHGLIPIAKMLEKLKTDKIAIGSIDEAVILRKNKIKTPIILLYPSFFNQFSMLLDLDVEITVNDYSSIILLNEIAKDKNKIAKIHIQINTGLNRYGVNINNAFKLISNIYNELSFIKIESLWTHFTDAEDEKLTTSQFNKFLNILKEISFSNIKIPSIHCANSSAIVNFKKSYNKKIFNNILPSIKVFVRPGCLIYGTLQDKEGRFFNKPIISSILTHITDINYVNKGEIVGYFKKYIAKKKLRIATIPIGWGNTGYLSKEATVLLNKKYANKIGLISSNNFAIDITNISRCNLETRVFLIKNNDKKISLCQVSETNNKFLNYFTSLLGSKIRKVYFK